MLGSTCMLLAASPLPGCTTTQDTAARLRLHSARLVASRKPIEVGRPSRDVKVLRATSLHDSSGTAVVVEMHNRGQQTVHDLPLAVGVRSSAGVTYLNRRPRTPYFQAHAPVIAAGDAATWVFASPKKVPSGRAVARVGAKPSTPLQAPDSLPEIEASATLANGKAPVARVEVHNDSGVTQYDLAPYVVATRQGRPVAAGEASITKLDPGDTQTIDIKLIGKARGATLHAYAAPTTLG